MRSNLLTIGTIESFDVGVLIRFAQLYEFKLDARRLAPFSECVAGELGAVVASNGSRLAVDLNELFDEPNDASRRNAGRHVDTEASTISFTDHT